jgi:hypothetical protein
LPRPIRKDCRAGHDPDLLSLAGCPGHRYRTSFQNARSQWTNG